MGFMKDQAMKAEPSAVEQRAEIGGISVAGDKVAAQRIQPPSVSLAVENACSAFVAGPPRR